MIAAILVICGTTAVSVSLVSCEKAIAQSDAPKVVSIELIRTDKSWDGVELPNYLEGLPLAVQHPEITE